MLQIHKLVKTYPNGEDKLYALNQVTLEIKNGEFAVILGPSGSGKSTLLNAISGLESVDSGSILYDGSELCGLNDRKLTEFRRAKTAYVFQSYYLLPALTVEANIRMGAALAGNREITSIINGVGLTGMEKRLPSQLSGGQQQRVSIARALAKKPDVLFCDEPTGALDEDTGRQVLAYLLDLQKKLNFIMVMVTHNANIAGLANRVIEMNSGKIVRTRENIKQAAVVDVAW